jgi:hypothetical protein
MSTDVKFVELPHAEYVVPIKTEKKSLNAFLKHLPTASSLEYLIEVLPKCNTDGPWIAGGALHRTYRKLPLSDSDVDVFFKNKEQLDKYLFELNSNALKSGKYSVKNYIVSEWHHTMVVSYMEHDWKIQCVSFKYFDTIEDLFRSFDINVCCIAYDGTNVVYEHNALNEINNNLIHFNANSINYPSVTLKRLVKYVKMGYDIEDYDLKVLTRAFYKSKKKAIDILDQDFLTKKDMPINNYQALT